MCNVLVIGWFFSQLEAPLVVVVVVVVVIVVVVVVVVVIVVFIVVVVAVVVVVVVYLLGKCSCSRHPDKQSLCSGLLCKLL